MPEKYYAELSFWQRELVRYQKWYSKEINELYGEPAPEEDNKVKVYSLKDSAILTWLETHQKRKYIEDLSLDKNAFAGMKLLDIGSGPFPSASVFDDCELYCLDPLIPKYIEIGFPIHYYNNVKFINSVSENIPVDDNFFDAVISVNAIDHVDNFFDTASEIQRVIKPHGKLRMHIHYHTKTQTEPISLNDDIVKSAFKWCDNFRKIEETKYKRGQVLAENDDSVYTLWSN